MENVSYGEKRARQATQVALEFARQMGGTFVTNADRRSRFVEKSEQEHAHRVSR
jgi:hypothetical protein